MRKNTPHGQIDKLVKDLRSVGYDIVESGKRYWIARGAFCDTVTFPSKVSEKISFEQIVEALTAAGFQLSATDPSQTAPGKATMLHWLSTRKTPVTALGILDAAGADADHEVMAQIINSLDDTDGVVFCSHAKTQFMFTRDSVFLNKALDHICRRVDEAASTGLRYELAPNDADLIAMCCNRTIATWVVRYAVQTRDLQLVGGFIKPWKRPKPAPAPAKAATKGSRPWLMTSRMEREERRRHIAQYMDRTLPLAIEAAKATPGIVKTEQIGKAVGYSGVMLETFVSMIRRDATTFIGLGGNHLLYVPSLTGLCLDVLVEITHGRSIDIAWRLLPPGKRRDRGVNSVPKDLNRAVAEALYKLVDLGLVAAAGGIYRIRESAVAASNSQPAETVLNEPVATHPDDIGAMSPGQKAVYEFLYNNQESRFTSQQINDGIPVVASLHAIANWTTNLQALGLVDRNEHGVRVCVPQVPEGEPRTCTEKIGAVLCKQSEPFTFNQARELTQMHDSAMRTALTTLVANGSLVKQGDCWRAPSTVSPATPTTMNRLHQDEVKVRYTPRAKDARDVLDKVTYQSVIASSSPTRAARAASASSPTTPAEQTATVTSSTATPSPAVKTNSIVKAMVSAALGEQIPFELIDQVAAFRDDVAALVNHHATLLHAASTQK